MKIALLSLAMLGACSAFLVPQSSLMEVTRHSAKRPSIQSSRAKGATVMLLGSGIPEAAGSTTWLLAAASRLEKFVPDTLADMAGDLSSDGGVVPVTPEMMDAASQAAQEVSRTSSLPPPYTLVVFAGILFFLAGFQQLSLGNVFDEEAKTGGSSGAVARKMNMRNRSFFKKR